MKLNKLSDVVSLSRPVRLSLRYTTPDIHCRDRRHECDGGNKTRSNTPNITVNHRLMTLVGAQLIAIVSCADFLYYSVAIRKLVY